MRLTTRQSVLIVGLVAVLVFALRIVLWQPLDVDLALSELDQEGARVSGVVHLHTVHSDGGGSVEDVARAAAEAGLDFVIITDHNTFGAMPFEGYIDDVLVIVGTEISTASGHIVGIGLTEPSYRFSGDARDTLQDIADLGGVAFVAHPTSPRPGLRWDDWDLPGPWGIELLNGDTQWRVSGWGRALWTSVLYPLNSTYALLQLMTRPTGFERWDTLLAARDVPAIAGSDSHSYVSVMQTLGIGVPSYRAVFGLARNHLALRRALTGDPARDRVDIIAALADGRSYIGVDGLAPASGFLFVAEDADGRWPMGTTVPPSPSLRLRAGGALAPGARLSLFKDGQVVDEQAGELVWPEVETGVYRVEVAVPGMRVPWIVSNAIYVFDHGTRDRRTREAQLVPPVQPAHIMTSVEHFDAGLVFSAAADPSTEVGEDVLDPDGGVEGSGAARLAFTLGAPSVETPSPFAALVSFERRDFSNADGLALWVRADGVYRVFVQVRDSNLASEDGTEWWSASIKTSTEWRRLGVPFRRFRTTDPATDGQLDLNQVEGVVFLIDIGAASPGTTGTIWFDDLALYQE